MTGAGLAGCAAAASAIARATSLREAPFNCRRSEDAATCSWWEASEAPDRGCRIPGTAPLQFRFQAPAVACREGLNCCMVLGEILTPNLY